MTCPLGPAAWLLRAGPRGQSPGLTAFHDVRYEGGLRRRRQEEAEEPLQEGTEHTAQTPAHPSGLPVGHRGSSRF